MNPPDFFFLRADILEESLSSTQTDGLRSHTQYIKKVKFLKPWWTATVFRYQSTQFNTLQQGTAAKPPISLSSTGRLYKTVVYLHMVSDQWSF